MRVLVCGSRDWTDKWAIWLTLNTVDPRVTTLIEGGARGADKLAREWVESHNILNPGSPIEHLPFPADWDHHSPNGCLGDCAGSRKVRPYCSLAGFSRNQQMLDEGKPDLVLGFVNKPLGKSRGTADMIERATSAQVRWFVIQCGPQTKPERTASSRRAG